MAIGMPELGVGRALDVVVAKNLIFFLRTIEKSHSSDFSNRSYACYAYIYFLNFKIKL
jgi:hypothetical protein